MGIGQDHPRGDVTRGKRCREIAQIFCFPEIPKDFPLRASLDQKAQPPEPPPQHPLRPHSGTSKPSADLRNKGPGAS